MHDIGGPQGGSLTAPDVARGRRSIDIARYEAVSRQLDTLPDDDALRTAIADLVADAGFMFFSYGTSPRCGERLSRSSQLVFITNYPAEWHTRYVRQRYQSLDTVVAVGERARRPFQWGGQRYLATLDKPRQTFFGEAGSFGIVHGYTIPVHGPDGDCGIFSISHPRQAEFGDALAAAILPLHALAQAVHARCIEQLAMRGSAEPQALTRRERECLAWTADGKTSGEIACILGRSIATVNFHLQSAIRKMDASNKHHAALKAHRLRLI